MIRAHGSAWRFVLFAFGIGLLLACSRLAGLPPVPESLTPLQAAVDRLDDWAEEARNLRRPITDQEATRFQSSPPDSPIDRARLALRLWNESGAGREALNQMGGALAADPSSLVLGNHYRMLVYRMKRRTLAEAKSRGERAPELPDYLRDEPLRHLERLAAADPVRAIRLQIALAYVDRMVLHPALEIKAPASIDSVRILSSILEGEDRFYLPALFARGLNYMHRPHDLVWPERPAPPANAASRDIGLAAAVGAHVGGAPDRLRGLLLMTLGDAHAVQREVVMARSWWMAARESCADETIRRAIALRMEWPDRVVPDRLEAHLAELMSDQQQPLSDLSFLWSDGT